jgi:hypothetical protein
MKLGVNSGCENRRIIGQQTPIHIARQEAGRIVAAQAQRRLRQVIGAEGKELRSLRDLTRSQRSAGARLSARALGP